MMEKINFFKKLIGNLKTLIFVLDHFKENTYNQIIDDLLLCTNEKEIELVFKKYNVVNIEDKINYLHDCRTIHGDCIEQQEITLEEVLIKSYNIEVLLFLSHKT